MERGIPQWCAPGTSGKYLSLRIDSRRFSRTRADDTGEGEFD
jgi:hypothetical protein